MKRPRHEAWAERMRALQAQARADLGGRVYSPQETAALIKQIATDAILVVSNDTDLTALSPWRGRLPILRSRDFVVRMVQTRRGR
ncbi:MAG: hypothetical protein KF727_02275 [Microbacteriaceae bacterium]|nr:hypothetical protein [Microbacteriaceae bacterium]